ncbi:MAG TPA: hypothetical protein VGJ70_23675 [Solirubrobacteraceae bacterium]
MSTFEHWRFEADGGDWADVLRRAGRARVPRWVLAAAAAALVLAAAPAVAVVTHAIGNGHGPRLIATLHGPEGEAGTFTLSPRHVLIPTSRKGGARVFAHGPRVSVTWKLELERGGSVTSLRLVGRRGQKTTLCAPCAASSGRATLPLRGAVFLFGPRAGVRAVVDGTMLSGRLAMRR